MPEDRYRLRDKGVLARLMRSTEPGHQAHTVQTLAKTCGLSASKIRKLLRGTRPTVTRQQAEIISTAVGAPMGVLFRPLSSASADADEGGDSMSSKDPQVLRLRAQIAAETSWANTLDPVGRTAPARAAADRRFVERAREMHPTATEEQIVRVAEHLRKAHMRSISLKAVAARAAKRQAKAA